MCDAAGKYRTRRNGDGETPFHRTVMHPPATVCMYLYQWEDKYSIRRVDLTYTI